MIPLKTSENQRRSKGGSKGNIGKKRVNGGKNLRPEQITNSIGIDQDSREFLNFLQDDICEGLIQRNKLSIHIETGNIYHDNVDTGESIYSFFIAQQDHTKKRMSEQFQFFESYEEYIMNYLTQIENETDDARDGSRTAATSKMERFVIIVNGFQPLTIITKRSILDVAAVLDPPLDALDMLTNKNTKFLFYHFNHYLVRIGQLLKFIRHSVIADDNCNNTITVIQERKWQYFIERLL